VPFVVTADQLSSRLRHDAVPETMSRLSARFSGVPLTRTLGDEFEALFTDPVSVVDAILILMRDGRWHVGVGVGEVDQPAPTDLREARGPAFIAARQAVEGAKDRADHLRIVAAAPADQDGQDAQVVMGLVLALRARRSPEGWAASDLSEEGLTQAEIATRLGISRQAVNQRLRAAQAAADLAARPVAARLLERADRLARLDRVGVAGQDGSA
jgi:hypothetical protein